MTNITLGVNFASQCPESSVDLCFESSRGLHQSIQVFRTLCGGVSWWDMCLLILYCTTSMSQANTTCKGDRRFLLKPKHRIYRLKRKLFKEIPEEKQSVKPYQSFPLLRFLNNWRGSFPKAGSQTTNYFPLVTSFQVIKIITPVFARIKHFYYKSPLISPHRSRQIRYDVSFLETSITAM